MDVMRASGAGGQHVNTTNSAVRITHAPSGIVVHCSAERSQHMNRDKAMSLLRSRLYEAERQRLESERRDMRRSQLGGASGGVTSGDRSERIRTYNFPQSRVTDHRIGLTATGVDRMLDGELLDNFIDALLLAEQDELLELMRVDLAAADDAKSKAAGDVGTKKKGKR
jgi:peptide chain release factor 1